MSTDADFLREKTEEGKRNNDFRDLMDSIFYDIREQTQAGLYSTTYRLRGDNIEFSDAVINNLTDGENPCDVEFDENTGVLSISWRPAD